MLNRNTKIWCCWILAVTHFGLTVGGDLLHQFSHQLAAVTHSCLESSHLDHHAESHQMSDEPASSCCCHSHQPAESVSHVAELNPACHQNSSALPENGGHQWSGPRNYHLCFADDCRFAQVTGQQGLEVQVQRVILDQVSTQVCQAIKSQRYSLDLQKTQTSRGPPSLTC